MSSETTRDVLLEKRRKIDAQIKAIDAKRRAQKRKDETRAKIIIGSVVMAEAQSDALFMQRLAALIDKHAGQKDQAFLAPVLTALADAAKAESAEKLGQHEAFPAMPETTPPSENGGILPAPYIKR